MRAETPAEQLFFTTAYLAAEGPAGESWTGTGFIISYTTSDADTVPVLVTNKHVLEGAATVTVRLVATGADGQPSSSATETRIVGFNEATWTGHANPAVDVAVMFLGPVLNQMAHDNQPPFFKGFTPELMLTEGQAQDLDALEEVTFVGYPNGLFDTASFLPIARRGQTATPIQNDYRGAPAFLIDASVFGGSSGSPVLIFDRGMYVTRDGSTSLGFRIHLLGVLAAVHIRQATGAIHDLPARQVAVFDEPIDLGIVYKSSAIQECVDALFAAAGVVIAPSVMPETPLA